MHDIQANGTSLDSRASWLSWEERLVSELHDSMTMTKLMVNCLFELPLGFLVVKALSMLLSWEF